MDQVATFPVSAPPRVRDWLRHAPDGPAPVVHTGPQALYVGIAGRAVGLLAAGATQVPNGLRSRLASLPSPLGVAHVREGVLHVAGRAVRVGRTVDVRVPRLVPVRATCATAYDVADRRHRLDALLGTPLPDELDPAGVRRLLGLGPGLTPLGDDVVAGWLAAARALAVPTPDVDDAVRAHVHRTTTLSATLLDCALHGEAVTELSAYLRSAGSPTEEDQAAALRRVGATSGAGLLSGAGIALRQLTPRGACVA